MTKSQLFISAAALALSGAANADTPGGVDKGAAPLFPTRAEVVYSPMKRPCTQLERGAEIAAAECGTIPLTDVASKYLSMHSN